MAKKSDIRQAIENILGFESSFVYIDPRGKRTNPKSEKDRSYTKYRMKLTKTHPESVLTSERKELISNLPGVIKVGISRGNPNSRSWSEGITVHFNCKPNSIKLQTHQLHTAISIPASELVSPFVVEKNKVVKSPKTTIKSNNSNNDRNTKIDNIISQLENIIVELKSQK